MRKALIAIITAAVLFTVGAFAANLSVTTENVASGEVGVGSCAEFVKVVDWNVPGGISGAPDNADWSTTEAKVEVTPYIGASCAGASVTLAIYSNDDSPGWSEYVCTGTGPTYTCAITGGLDVSPIEQVAVLVNGDTFDIDA